MDHFWSKVDKRSADECWPWTAGAGASGHGRFMLERKAWKAHRVAWMLTHGRHPGKSVIRHKCDNPRCCNPAHLVAGTQADNVRDMDRRGRRVNSLTKLTVEQVCQIRRSNSSDAELAVALGVSPRTIDRARRGATHWSAPVPPVIP